MYKGFLVARNVISQDPHFSEGCTFCHQGDEKGRDKAEAHRDLVKRPSDDLQVCGGCHEEISKTYQDSLHYSTAGLRFGIIGRFSEEEVRLFDREVFAQSCRSCHASCGDCHVKGPLVGGISVGLIEAHRFVRKDEAKTCAFCHGGRVYPEFTGQYGVIPDVHCEKGMMCLDCHHKEELHGDGNTYTSRREVGSKPSCAACHPAGSEKNEKAKQAHEKHKEKVSCTACHALSTYKNCYNCHLGKGGISKSGFILGRNPRNREQITTLRIIPTVKDTFKDVGIEMKNFDSLPNYWDSVPHNTRKTTERTNNCNMCHLLKVGFLKKGSLISDGSGANEALIYTPQPIKQ